VSAFPLPVASTSGHAQPRARHSTHAAPRVAPPRALRALQLGALLVVLAAARYKLFELDRFFVPKELVLHATAAVIAVWRFRTPTRDTAHDGTHDTPRGVLSPVDVALGVYLLLSALSTLAAGNRWLAVRALAVTCSGAALFWGARALARAGHGRALLAGLGVATVAGAATALLQAYGVESVYFSLNRAPGGTFGNRNFVAHLAAIGTPLLVGVALRARARTHALAASVGAGALATVLVLTRSRGAWLAAAAAAVPLAIGLWRARRVPGPRPRPGRLILLALTLAGGAATALTVPNTLEWRSDSPYLDSVKGVVDYRGGSGRGRLKQYANSARLTLDRPLLGVGPGNWAADYPRYAPAGDPSFAGDGTTANPWPSSDWVAVASERGVPALLAFALTFLGLAWWAHLATWRARTSDHALTGGLLGATLAATLVAGAFDAVLLLPAPAFLAWTTLGALSVESGGPDLDDRRVLRWSPAARRAAWALLALAAVVGALRSTAQAAAMAFFSTGRPTAIARAATLDPGSYRIHLRLAELAAARRRCADVRRHAEAAAELLPSAPAPKRLLARCAGGRRNRRA
jgi:O-antigen ligase